MDVKKPKRPPESIGNFWLMFMGSLVWAILLTVGGQGYWQGTADPYSLYRAVIRILVIVPLCSSLALFVMKAHDYLTFDSWEKRISQEPLPCAIVYAALIYGAFWLCVQG